MTTPPSSPAALPALEIREFLDACGAGRALRDRPDQIVQFYADLTAANAKTNLTRITTPEEFWTKHVADSLAVGRFVPRLLEASLTVADVGCGAGFPLFPLAWANPALRLTGIETNGKKVQFLEEEAARLGMAQVRILGRQAREAGRLPDHAASCDVVVSRAVTNPAMLIRECRQLLKPDSGAALVVYTTPEAVALHWSLARREADKYGMNMQASDPIRLPLGAGERQFLLFARP